MAFLLAPTLLAGSTAHALTPEQIGEAAAQSHNGLRTGIDTVKALRRVPCQKV